MGIAPGFTPAPFFFLASMVGFNVDSSRNNLMDANGGKKEKAADDPVNVWPMDKDNTDIAKNSQYWAAFTADGTGLLAQGIGPLPEYTPFFLWNGFNGLAIDVVSERQLQTRETTVNKSPGDQKSQLWTAVPSLDSVGSVFLQSQWNGLVITSRGKGAPLIMEEMKTSGDRNTQLWLQIATW